MIVVIVILTAQHQNCWGSMFLVRWGVVMISKCGLFSYTPSSTPKCRPGVDAAILNVVMVVVMVCRCEGCGVQRVGGVIVVVVVGWGCGVVDQIHWQYYGRWEILHVMGLQWGWVGSI